MSVQYRCDMDVGQCYKKDRPCCFGCDERRICDSVCKNHPSKCRLSQPYHALPVPKKAGAFDGSKLATLRIDAGYSGAGFANAIGTKQTTLWKWEHNQRVPKDECINQFCSILGCERQALMS